MVAEQLCIRMLMLHFVGDGKEIVNEMDPGIIALVGLKPWEL